MRSVGADRVIDYVQEDFTENGEQYDLILELVAAHSIFDYRRALSPRGRYIMVGGSLPHIFQTLFLGSLISIMGSRKMSILGAEPNKGLAFVLELIESGDVTPVIDARYPLSQAAEALRYLGEGRARGKVVITM